MSSKRPSKSRGKKAGTVTGDVAAFDAVAKEVERPSTVKLRPGDLPIWKAIVCARAREEWKAVDLHHAANLTRCLADIERISAEIEVDGDVLTNDRGAQIANPKHALLETLSRRSVALTRLLHLHASVLSGSPNRTIPAREAEEQARAAITEDGDDGLLATPIKH